MGAFLKVTVHARCSVTGWLGASATGAAAGFRPRRRHHVNDVPVKGRVNLDRAFDAHRQEARLPRLVIDLSRQGKCTFFRVRGGSFRECGCCSRPSE